MRNLLSGLIFCFVCFVSVSCQDVDSLESRLRNDNPHWVCEKDSYSLLYKDNGWNLYLKGPDLKNLSALKHHDFSVVILDNVEVKDLAFLANSTKLKQLVIQNSPELTDISALRGKPLKKFYLYHTGVEDFDAVYDAPLCHLLLPGSKISDLSKFRNLNELTYLNLSDCSNIHTIDSLKDCNHLKKIDLSGTSVNDASPLYGKEFDYFEIDRTPIASKGIPANITLKKQKEKMKDIVETGAK